MSSLGWRELVLAQSVSQRSCAALGSCLAVPGGGCDCQALYGLIPSSCHSSAQGWDRGTDLPSVVTRMKWSVLHSAPPWLPCGLGSSLCSKWYC